MSVIGMFSRLIKDMASDLATQKNISKYVDDDLLATEVWRGTASPRGTEVFQSFSGPRELGTHVGTKTAAESMMTEGDTLFRGITNIKNPLHFEEDLGHWDVSNIINRLIDHTGYNRAYSGIDNNIVFSDSAAKVFRSIKNKVDIEQENLKKKYDKLIKKNPDSTDDLAEMESNALEKIRIKYAKQLQKILKKEGYDSISYLNTHEDEGNPSFILFDPQQFKDIEGNIGTFSKSKESMLQGIGMFGLGMGEEE